MNTAKKFEAGLIIEAKDTKTSWVAKEPTEALQKMLNRLEESGNEAACLVLRKELQRRGIATTTRLKLKSI